MMKILPVSKVNYVPMWGHVKHLYVLVTVTKNMRKVDC